MDLLACDFSSRALGAIEVRTADELLRSAKRLQRLVMVAARGRVVGHEWNEHDLPGMAQAREVIIAEANTSAGEEVMVAPGGCALTRWPRCSS